MSGWGGARSGAGRKPKVVEDASHSILVEVFNEAAERKIIRAMITAATRDRNVSAATWLWDRKYGKVKDQVELSGPGGQPLFKAYEKDDTFDPDQA